MLFFSEDHFETKKWNFTQVVYTLFRSSIDVRNLIWTYLKDRKTTGDLRKAVTLLKIS